MNERQVSFSPSIIQSINFNKIKFQYASIFVANIISYSHGFGVGWLSTAIPILKSEQTTLKSGPLTLQQLSWLGGSYPLGALFGDVLFSVLLNFMGRRSSMMLLAIPNLIFWLAALLSTSYTELVVGRFIGGITGGGILVLMPVFVAEIANKQIRGFIGVMCPLSIAVGVLVAYICGAFLQFSLIPYCVIGFPVLFLVVMFVIPETPLTLIRQNKLQKAEQSLNFYNNGNSKGAESGYNVAEELAKLQSLVSRKDNEKKNHTYTLILQKESMKKVFIGISLVGLSMCSGIIVVTMYAAQLFIDSGAQFNPYVSAIIVGALQVCGIYVSSMLVDKIGRKILFGVSSLLSAVSLIIFGTFSFLNTKGIDLSSVDWLPVTSLSFYIFVNSVGLRTVPFLYIAEILPYNVRQMGVTICMIVMSTFAFLTVFTKPILQDWFDLHVVIWIYAGICTVGVFFSIFVMVETKGKNLNRVPEM